MINAYRDRLNQLKGQRNTIEQELHNKRKTKEELSEKLILIEECRLITQFISENNQAKLTSKINGVVTDAIQSVFGEDYEFRMEITTKANAIQANPMFYHNGLPENPKMSEGGGMLAVASLALRVVLLTLLKNPTPIMILDEPFSAVSNDGGCLERAVDLLRTISEKLDIEILVITHGTEIKERANRVFHVSMKDKESKIITKDNEKIITQEEIANRGEIID